MNRSWRFLATASMVACLSGPFLVGQSCAKEREVGGRPNFLIIVADDLHWRDLSCMGNPDVKTPHLDRLAAQSMTLGGMYSPAATCSPARHALYTGLYPIRSGAYPNHTMVDSTTRSIFGYLKAAGYRVGLQGKSHVHPAKSFPYELISKDPDDHRALARFVTRKPARPWLAVFASHDPHTPWTRGPQQYYQADRLRVPQWMHDNPQTRAALAQYYGEVSELDSQVGRCLRVLDDVGEAENTFVLFLSEQGSAFPYGGKWTLYENGIRIAAFARWPGRIQPGSRSHALMQYVDVPATMLDAAGSNWRELDTGCPDASGKVVMDGDSFLPVLLGSTDHHRDYVFAEHTTVGVNGYRQPYPSRSVSDGRFKLIWNLASENQFWIRGIHESPIYQSWVHDAKSNPQLAERVRWLSYRSEKELYDLRQDPFETRNLAAQADLKATKERLERELSVWMMQQGDEGMTTELRARERQPRRRRK